MSLPVQQGPGDAGLGGRSAGLQQRSSMDAGALPSRRGTAQRAQRSWAVSQAGTGRPRQPTAPASRGAGGGPPGRASHPGLPEAAPQWRSSAAGRGAAATFGSALSEPQQGPAAQWQQQGPAQQQAMPATPAPAAEAAAGPGQPGDRGSLGYLESLLQRVARIGREGAHEGEEEHVRLIQVGLRLETSC
jgi:hypothetical protein